GSVFNYDFVIGDPFHARLEHGLHLTSLDAILNVRPYPILDRRTKFLLAVYKRHTRTVSIEIVRRLSGGVFSADHYNVLLPMFVGFRVIVRYVREFLSQHS